MDSGDGSTEGGAATRDASSGVDSAADGAIATPRPSTTDSGLGPNELGSSALVCEDHSDVAAALIGMHPSAVWLTRLEMELPREALIMDCRVARAQADAPITNQVTPGTYKGDPCPEGAVLSGGTSASFSAFPWATGSFAALGLLRRRRRRVPS